MSTLRRLSSVPRIKDWRSSVTNPRVEKPFFFDAISLGTLAQQHGPAYREADPFPHAIFDDFVPDDFLQDVLEEFPKPEQVDWYLFDNQREKKLTCQDETQMGARTRHLIAQLSSSIFFNFLSELTGHRRARARPLSPRWRIAPDPARRQAEYPCGFQLAWEYAHGA